MPSDLNERFQILSRLHNILAEAHAKGETGVDATWLQSELGCERTTFYRHRQVLQSMGAPIEYDKKTAIWRYAREWNPPWSWIATISGAAGLRLSMNFLLDPELERDLTGIVVPSPAAKSSRAIVPRLTGIVDKSVFPHISLALRENRVLEFQYAKPNTESGLKRVQPLSIFAWDGMPYLQAIDTTDESRTVKRYALSRISRPRVTDARFRPPSRKDAPTCLGAFSGKTFTARFVADAPCAPYVLERKWHADQRQERRKDGSIVFELPFGDTGEAARWILGRGPGFRPLGPPDLVKAWQEMIRKLNGSLPDASVGPA